MSIEFRCTQCGKLLRTAMTRRASRQVSALWCGDDNSAAHRHAWRRAPADSGNPYQAPTVAPAVLDLGDVFSRTWTIFKEQWTMCLAAWLIVLAESCDLVWIEFWRMLVGQVVLGRESGLPLQFGKRGRGLGQRLAGHWLGDLLSEGRHGQTADFNDLFSGGPYYVNILLPPSCSW